MTSILDQIVVEKKREVADRKISRPDPLKSVQRSKPRSFAASLADKTKMGVIAEYKKASPSKGVIRTDLDPVDVAGIYQSHGAVAVSVLTDETFFQGHADFLTAIHDAVSLPVLRKDFTIDSYQIDEAYAIGADAVLLIVSLLTVDELIRFQAHAGELGLACLIEAHNLGELDKALEAGAEIVGINNRDLADFSVTLQTSLDLKGQIPQGIITVSESGIHDKEDVNVLAAAGFDAVLVGESLMRSPDIGAQLSLLTGWGGPLQ